MDGPGEFLILLYSYNITLYIILVYEVDLVGRFGRPINFGFYVRLAITCM